MLEEFVLLFTNMGVIPWVFFMLGIVLLGIEMCVPGFGVFGICGIASMFVAVLVRAVEGAKIVQILMFVIICLLLILLFFVLLPLTMKSKLISKTGIIETGQVLEKNYVCPKNVLIGKEGITLSDCKPAGAVMVNNEKYDCVSEDKYIKKGTKVIVSNVKSDNIIIKTIEEKKK